MKQQLTIELDVPEGKIAVYNTKTNKVEIKTDYTYLPKSFSEFLYFAGINNSFVIDNTLIKSSKSKSVNALVKLIAIRDYWYDKLNYTPNWSDTNNKYIIVNRCGTPCCGSNNNPFSTILAFPNPEIRDLFYDSFEELIKLALPLL